MFIGQELVLHLRYRGCLVNGNPEAFASGFSFAWQQSQKNFPLQKKEEKKNG